MAADTKQLLTSSLKEKGIKQKRKEVKEEEQESIGKTKVKYREFARTDNATHISAGGNDN